MFGVIGAIAAVVDGLMGLSSKIAVVDVIRR